MKKIQKHLQPLYNLLFNLTDKVENNLYWFELDRALRIYLGLYTSTFDQEDALIKLELELCRRYKYFTPKRGDNDDFIQKCYLLKRAFKSHILKLKRPEISQELKIMGYIKDEHGRLPTSEDEERYRYLIKLRKKI